MSSVIATVGWNDGSLSSALFYSPFYLSIDSNGNVYFVDRGNQVIKQINFNTSSVITIAGNGNVNFLDGIGSSASFNYPTSVYVNAAGSIMYVADYGSSLIRQISCSAGMFHSFTTYYDLTCI